MKTSLRISNRKGKIVRIFMIMELLIVISVIAILSSLLLPALNSAREKAQAITCTGNLKQIGQELSRTGDDTSGKRWDRTRKMGVNTVAFRGAQHRTFLIWMPIALESQKPFLGR